ncbi:MAG: hypothetical protein Q8Q09_20545 [Deltaproteobacteria bacterium]|nr:hypothetical protein [Deltaproteobacteria bacterium]
MSPCGVRVAMCLALAMSGCVVDVVLARERDGASEQDATSDPSQLRVEGEIIASLGLDEASGDDPTETRFALRLFSGNQRIMDATVTLESSLGTLTMSTHNAQYSATQRGYATQYTVVVTRPMSTARWVIVGPEAHRIVQPVREARVRAMTELPVRWEPAGMAETSVSTEHMPETPTGDTGTFVVPASALVGAPADPVDDKVMVRRTRVVTPMGAALGSSIRVSLRAERAFVITP